MGLDFVLSTNIRDLTPSNIVNLLSIKDLKLIEKIKLLCQELETEFDLISAERKQSLLSLSAYVSQKLKNEETPQLIVICTHNSRRSHMGQLWLAAAADYFELPKIQTFSGGTEATTFNPRAVKAIEKMGFSVSVEDDSIDNPMYHISWKKEMEPYRAFSKKYSASPNPVEKFGAIMVCTEADNGCPIVLGCDFRLSLPFEDPKAFDDTDLADQMYDERARQIGREILYSFSNVNQA